MPPPTSLWNRCLQCCADSLRAALAAGPPLPERVQRHRHHATLELSIRPACTVLVAGGVLLLLCSLLAWDLQHRGALWAAAFVALGGGAQAWGLWSLQRNGVGRIRRLHLLSTGGVLLVTPHHSEEARLAPCSLRIGSHVLLLFRGPPAPVRLLLGPENLSAGDYAALGRWLQRMAGGQGTAAGPLR